MATGPMLLVVEPVDAARRRLTWARDQPISGVNMDVGLGPPTMLMTRCRDFDGNLMQSRVPDTSLCRQGVRECLDGP